MIFDLFGGPLNNGKKELTDVSVYQGYTDFVIEAEALGFHGIFLVEHHFSGVKQTTATIEYLSYLAARTTTIRLGTGVIAIPWHNPVLLAEQIATLDVLSNGRVDFGVGKGYRPYEFKGFNIPIEESFSRFEEGLEVIRKALNSSGSFSHDGNFWKFTDVFVEPTPVQKPIPMWNGAVVEKTIRYAAQNEFNLLLDQHADLSTHAENICTYKSTLASDKKNFSPENVGIARALYISLNNAERDKYLDRHVAFMKTVSKHRGENNTRTNEELRHEAEKIVLIGDSEEIIQKIYKIKEIGCERLLLVVPDNSIDHLHVFSEKIMPEFT